MNTPSHIIVNLAVLGRKQAPDLNGAVVIGALLPDAAMVVFYLWAKAIAHLPDAQIWSSTFFQPGWQQVFAVGNSIPLALLGLAIAAAGRYLPGVMMCGSMLLHQLEDLPLHHDDAHMHFFPLSSYRFISPISYWDPAHYGAIAALGEVILVLFASLRVSNLLESSWVKGLLFFVNLVYVAGYVAMYVEEM